MSTVEVFAKQQLLTELPSGPGCCPFCTSNEIVKGGMETTLLGGGRGTDDDPNHTWTDCHCVKCGCSFSRQTKYGNVWYTERDRVTVLQGIANCFESFNYQCAACEKGRLRLFTTKLDGVSSTNFVRNAWVAGKSIRQYREFYQCDNCDIHFEINEQIISVDLS